MPKRPLLPGFLTKLDDYLLINKPAIWTARTHLVLWYAILFAATLTLLCFVVSMDPRQFSKVQYWVLFVIVISLLGLVVWLIFLLRFNVFKRHGNLPRAYGIKTFSLYLIIVGSIIASNYIPSIVESIRANKAYDNIEVVRDINTINLDICKLERDSIKLDWDSSIYVLKNDSDTTTTVSDVPTEDDQVMARADSSASVTTSPDDHVTRIYYMSRGDLQRRIDNADSMMKMNDTTYVFYQCPDYNFLAPYHEADKYSPVKVLKSHAIYNRILKHYTRPDRKAVRKELDSLAHKYYNERYQAIYTYARSYDYVPSDYGGRLRQRYSLSEIDNSMMNIIDKKYRWTKKVVENNMRSFYYFSLVITLLVFIFRHSTKKAFFLSLLTGVVLLIITSLFFAFIQAYSGLPQLIVIAFYFWLFAIMSLTIRLSRIRNTVKGIALNLATVLLPFMPLLGVELYYTFLRRAYPMYGEFYAKKYIHYNLHVAIAEAAGFVLLLVLLDTVIMPLYRRWYALPEQ